VDSLKEEPTYTVAEAYSNFGNVFALSEIAQAFEHVFPGENVNPLLRALTKYRKHQRSVKN
jgi:hypothetical protein